MRTLFKILIGLSALFIAGCSAFFSVRGLGMLFVGSATAVMVMAASLEVGKLIAASFLYQYWPRIGIAVRAYLMLAVAVLVGITSLGIYGYLARAYEQTNAEVALLHHQEESIEREMADVQRRIDASRGQIGKLSDTDRQDIDKLQAQIVSAQQSLEQSLGRLDSRRKGVQEKRDKAVEDVRQRTTQTTASFDQALARLEDRRKASLAKRDGDVATLAARSADAGKMLTAALASEDVEIAALNERIAVLDRAVDAYTREGGPGILKDDSIRKGQVLREQQKKQRDAIAAEIATHRATQDDLRKAHAATVKEIDAQIAAAGGDLTKERAAISEEEKALRKGQGEALATFAKSGETVAEQFARDAASIDEEDKTLRAAKAGDAARAQQQIALLQGKSQSTLSDGNNQIEALYQRLRSGGQEVKRIQDQIASTDVGTYRFIARAFNAPVDDVVKWLMLVIVLVFDPLAVALTIGFNVVMASDSRRRSSTDLPAAGGTNSGSSHSGGGFVADEASGVPPAAGAGRGWGWAVAVVSAMLIAALIIGVASWGVKATRQSAVVAHAKLIPADSFAVVTFRPAMLRAPANAADKVASASTTTGPANAAELLGQPVIAAIADLLSSGFDPNADVYAFLKYPTDRSNATASGGTDRPVMLAGLVARVTDVPAAEASLSRCAETITRALRPTAAAGSSLTRNRLMVQAGRGRYLDPEGGFFSFGMTDGAAVILLEIEGNPARPSVEREMKLCLAGDRAEGGVARKPAATPSRAMPADGAVGLWFDAAACFADMPKSAPAVARYQQLQRYLDFDLSLVVRPAEGNALRITGQYSYANEHFRAGDAPPVIDILTKLGSAEPAGLQGRLMDRCADTLDFDSLIDHLRVALADPRRVEGRPQVVVEKSTESDRDAQFSLVVRYDPKAGPPLLAAFRSLSLF
ncbi:MAG: hypothetical protein NTW19_06620 [Planctomycetota bacterium]|nr:hypothetical protein [Planctomycetota bacterium]